MKTKAPEGRHLNNMANTYTQLYTQIVFAVKYRENLIAREWKEELNKYISGIITRKGQKSIIVNGMPDHIHVFVGLKPTMTVSELVREIKCNSTNFINEKKFVRGRFSWQEGFGAFSYTQSHIHNVYQYILHQEEHHKIRTFKQEYIDFLKNFEIEYSEKFLFDWICEN